MITFLKSINIFFFQTYLCELNKNYAKEKFVNNKSIRLTKKNKNPNESKTTMKHVFCTIETIVTANCTKSREVTDLRGGEY